MTAAPIRPAAALDPIAELKLRRWARLNHVPADDRDPRWHPVVWNEMAARDRELAALPVDANQAGFDRTGANGPRFTLHAGGAGVRGPVRRPRAGRPAAMPASAGR